MVIKVNEEFLIGEGSDFYGMVKNGQIVGEQKNERCIYYV